jgi:hypothetical protein
VLSGPAHGKVPVEFVRYLKTAPNPVPGPEISFAARGSRTTKKRISMTLEKTETYKLNNDIFVL